MDTSLRHRSVSVFPAGSNGEFGFPLDRVPVIERGAGALLWDTDGKEYFDFSMAWGSALPGHAHPELILAMEDQFVRGLNFSHVTKQSLLLAETIRGLSPAAERLRFCASGTEATLYCLRIARGCTGRSRVLRFEGAYHGSHDVGVTSLFPHQPTEFPTPVPSCGGVTASARQDILVSQFNDLELTRQIVDEHAREIAAILVEPFQRCLPPKEGFLEGLRELATMHGILLVFDEVVTGFRLALGGAQEYYGVVPDLVAYGKALGGGCPLGAYGGRAEVMQVVDEARLGQPGYVWSASSSGGNPVSAAAALAAIDLYSRPVTYEHLHGLGRYFRAGLAEAFANSGFDHPVRILGDGPLAQFALTSEPATTYRTSRHERPDLARRIMLGLFERGIFLNPMGTKLYLSLAHTQAHCDQFVERLEEVLVSLSPLPLRP